MANPKVVAGLVFAVIIVVMIIVLVATSLKKLSSDQIGLAYDTINKDLDKEAKTEGLHNGPPGFEFIIFPSVYKTLTFDNLRCLNADGVIITLDVTYQYKAKAQKLYDIVMNFKDYDGYKTVLQYTGESALHEACSYFNTSQFQAERGAFQEKVRDKIVEKYEVLYCDITDLQVSNIARPSEYESAIRSKERAREDIQVAFNERPRLITEAETEKREANTTAQIILDKANSDARILKARAEAEAEGIIQQYEKESEAYQQILSSSGLGFTVEGFISYMGVRVISSAKNPVYIGLQSPAKSSYQTP
ncbi:uncharacterized protein LOC123539069 [Mercenaria mercenaria]|uniref:uncharacterized protein LOC123539069 n=1 Tax=Mercenaria mercenaria TaxID=6596 RepID=UPI00234ECCB7|nr:uncharacterized protein LOC123539069 [Mercenaria mercenaria]XP_053385380.1 uncharacterized protein LOC123539069 [Mercenaria mercenaria]